MSSVPTKAQHAEIARIRAVRAIDEAIGILADAGTRLNKDFHLATYELDRIQARIGAIAGETR